MLCDRGGLDAAGQRRVNDQLDRLSRAAASTSSAPRSRPRVPKKPPTQQAGVRINDLRTQIGDQLLQIPGGRRRHRAWLRGSRRPRDDRVDPPRRQRHAARRLGRRPNRRIGPSRPSGQSGSRRVFLARLSHPCKPSWIRESHEPLKRLPRLARSDRRPSRLHPRRHLRYDPGDMQRRRRVQQHHVQRRPGRIRQHPARPMPTASSSVPRPQAPQPAGFTASPRVPRIQLLARAATPRPSSIVVHDVHRRHRRLIQPIAAGHHHRPPRLPGRARRLGEASSHSPACTSPQAGASPPRGSPWPRAGRRSSEARRAVRTASACCAAG